MYKRYGGFSLNLVWTLIGVNLIVFIAVQVRPDLVVLLGLQPASFPREPWTLISSMFTHASFWHLFANMLTLYFFGSFLLGMVGEGRFLLVYFGGGILGGLLYVLLAPMFVIGIGASGAVFGLGGALAMLRPKVPVMIFPIPVPVPLWVAVIGGFIILTLLFPTGIAWQAHLGGLIFGLGYGYTLRRRGYF